MKERVCTSCGYVGKPIRQSYESFMVDLMLWLVVGNLALMSGLLPFIIIPAAWTIYHIAKFHTTKCPKCSDLSMVSVNSAQGKAVINQQQGRPQPWSDGQEMLSAK